MNQNLVRALSNALCMNILFYFFFFSRMKYCSHKKKILSATLQLVWLQLWEGSDLTSGSLRDGVAERVQALPERQLSQNSRDK